jgi:DNA end-binding protein Ku
MHTVDAGTGEPVNRSDLVKGYQYAKNEFVILEKEELDAIKLESTKTIDIEKFVAREGIDRLYWETPYHLVPEGKTGVEAFAVIREAMRQKKMVALGRLVMNTREWICGIEVEEDALLLTTLRTAEEVRAISDIGPSELPKPDPRMLDIAGKIIEQQAGDFDPSEFKDRYEDALRALIEEKKKGVPVRPTAVAEESSNVVDLMEALKRSLNGSDRQPPATAPAARERAAKPKRPANRNKSGSGKTRAA